VDVLHGDLEAVETARFRHLHFFAEPFNLLKTKQHEMNMS
jgi:hypothetical protein